jgi:hypothetical protein
MIHPSNQANPIVSVPGDQGVMNFVCKSHAELYAEVANHMSLEKVKAKMHADPHFEEAMIMADSNKKANVQDFSLSSVNENMGARTSVKRKVTVLNKVEYETECNTRSGPPPYG